MSELKVMISRLSPLARKGLEQAARLCVEYQHAEVDLPHLVRSLLASDENDWQPVLAANGVSAEQLASDFQQFLIEQPVKTGHTPVFSTDLARMLEQGWGIASSFGRHQGHFNVRTGHLLLACLNDAQASLRLGRISPLWLQLDANRLKDDFDRETAGSFEQPAEAPAAAEPSSPATDSATEKTATPALDQYTFNLTRKAAEGKIDPVIGREDEVRQMIDILMRRRQNNPILTGEAGVGKTAVVEGLALKISQGDVPDPLKNVQMHVLDMGLLQAGASVKGEFENRLKHVIQEVQASSVPIILFIDEAHTLIGAGGAAGQNDAANLLKPALARGELRTIAATTWAEYKKYFEKDAALARRFQVVKVEEPSVETAVKMLRAMVPHMQQHFGIAILDEALHAAASLSARYISGRQLPDKAVSVLDTAAARVALSRSARPGAIDRLQARLHDLQLEITQLQGEMAERPSDSLGNRLVELDASRVETGQALARVTAQWQREKELLEEIGRLRLENARTPALDTQVALDQAVAELAALQQSQPLVHDALDARVVGQVISDWTGIPLGNMQQDDLQGVLTLADALNARVIGQRHALQAIAQRVQMARAGLEDPNRPQGVFLFAGPSGVGKTETALALADRLYGGERNIITINMSEYQEAHTVSSLKGAPPGYVGYGEGGVLTEAVRRRPYSVVLLDELEKAHPDVLEMFYQVFDKGWMEDGEGRYIDFKNTLIIMTSNVGSSQIMQACLNVDEAERPDPEGLMEQLRPALYKTFKPAFLGRMKVIPYYPMTDAMLYEIIQLKLSHVRERIESTYNVPFSYDDAVLEVILDRCMEVDTGARNIDHILNSTILPALATRILQALAAGQVITGVSVSCDDQAQLNYHVATEMPVSLPAAVQQPVMAEY